MYIKIAGNAVAAASQQHFGLPATAAAVRRLFHRSTGVVAMGHGSHVSDNDPKVLEREKQRNLQGEVHCRQTPTKTHAAMVVCVVSVHCVWLHGAGCSPCAEHSE